MTLAPINDVARAGLYRQSRTGARLAVFPESDPDIAEAQEDDTIRATRSAAGIKWRINETA